MFDIEFLKDGYDAELERKDALSEALTLPAGVLGAIVSALAIMGQGFPYRAGNATTLFIGILCLDGLCLLACLVYLARAYHGRSYVYLPRLGELVSAQQDLRHWHRENGGSATEADSEFQELLKGRLVDAADQNAHNNDQRSALLFVGRLWLFGLLALTALTSGAYMTGRMADVERTVVQVDSLPPLKIEGLDTLLKEIAMAKTPPPQPDPTSTATPKPASKPTFPSNRVVKEGTLPPKK